MLAYLRTMGLIDTNLPRTWWPWFAVEAVTNVSTWYGKFITKEKNFNGVWLAKHVTILHLYFNLKAA